MARIVSRFVFLAITLATVAGAVWWYQDAIAETPAILVAIVSVTSGVAALVDGLINLIQEHSDGAGSGPKSPWPKSVRVESMKVKAWRPVSRFFYFFMSMMVSIGLVVLVASHLVVLRWGSSLVHTSGFSDVAVVVMSLDLFTVLSLAVVTVILWFRAKARLRRLLYIQRAVTEISPAWAFLKAPSGRNADGGGVPNG